MAQFFKVLFKNVYVYACSACVYVCAPCTHLVFMEVVRNDRPATEVGRRCGPGCLNLGAGHLQASAPGVRLSHHIHPFAVNENTLVHIYSYMLLK